LSLLRPAFLLRKFSHPIAGKRGLADTEPFENFQRFWNIGPSGALAEVRFGPQGRKFLGDCNVNELVQRRVFCFDDTAQFLQERRLKAKRKSCSFA
jgi:hypothetical protein